MIGNSQTVSIRIDVDAKDGIRVTQQVGDEFKRLGSAMDDAGTKASNTGMTLGGMARAIGAIPAPAALAAAAVAAMVAGLRSAVAAASDMQESQNKVNVIYGASAQVINNWAKDSVNAFGLSREAALSAAGTMGNMWQQLGAGTQQAAENSMAMTELAADLASFHNAAGGAEEVLVAMQSAFRGEYDALQRYIPTINAAAVQQEALAQTGKTAAGELTALEKATAAQAIIMRDAGAAVGDFGRTSEEYANAVRKMDAHLTDLSANIGALFLPAAAEAVKVINFWADATNNLFDSLDNSDWLDHTKAQYAALGNEIQELEATAAGTGMTIFNFFSGPGEQTEAEKKLEILRKQYELLGKTIEQETTKRAQESGAAMTKTAEAAVDAVIKGLNEQYAATNAHYEAVGKAALKANDADVKAFKAASDARQKQFEREATEMQRVREKFSDQYQRLVLDDYDYAVLTLGREVEEFRRAGVDKERLAEYYTRRLGDLQNKHLEVVEGSNNEQYDSELTKWQRIEAAGMAGADEAIKRHQAMADEAKASASEQAQAYAQLYSDLGRTTQESYQHKVDLLDQEYKQLEEVLGDSELLQAAYAQRKKELDWEIRLSGDDMLAGMLVAWEQYEDGKKTLAEQGAQFFADTHTAMRDTAGDIFFDALTGDLKDLGDYAEAIWQSIARSFADMAAQMVADYAMSGLMDLLKPSSSGGGLVSGVLGAVGDLGGSIVDAGGDALAWLADLWPFAQGAWEITEDQIAKLHEGEMVVPAEFADYVQALINASGSGMSWNQGYTGPPINGGEAGWAARQYYEQNLSMSGPDHASMFDPAVGGADASAYWSAYNAGYFAPGGASGGSLFGGLTSSMSPGGMGAYTGGAADSSYAEQVMAQAAAYGFASGTLPVIAAGLSYGVPIGDFISVALEAGVQSAINGMVGAGLTSLAGFDTTAGKIGAYIGSMMGSELGPLSGIAGFAGAVVGESIADLFNLRSDEAVRDYYEDAFGFFGSHYIGGRADGGGMNTGAPVHIGAGGTTAFGMRHGGWTVGPDSGYEVVHHGTEYVLNADQVKAVRDLFGMGGGSRQPVVKVIVDGAELGRMIRAEADGVAIEREIREIRGRRNTTGASPARVR